MKKRYMHAGMGVGGLLIILLLLLVVIPRIYIKPSLINDYFPKTYNTNETEMSILLVGENLRETSFIINGKEVNSDDIIETGDDNKYAWIKLDISKYKTEEELDILCKSNIVFFSKSNAIKIRLNDDCKNIDLDIVNEDVSTTIMDSCDGKQYMMSYFERLATTPYTVYISICDEGTSLIDDELMEVLSKLGMETDLRGQYRASYVGILNSGKSIYEEISKYDIAYYCNDDVEIISAGCDVGNCAQINIWGNEMAVGECGLNIVVYDEENKVVKDSVVFDTNADYRIRRLKNYGLDFL